jgi:hypothetical protein
MKIAAVNRGRNEVLSRRLDHQIIQTVISRQPRPIFSARRQKEWSLSDNWLDPNFTQPNRGSSCGNEMNQRVDDLELSEKVVTFHTCIHASKRYFSEILVVMS